MSARSDPPGSAGDLTIAQLAQHTGLNAGTLRMWESRYGFPTPTRTPSGHRRYTLAEVERVERVARDRDAGMSLPLAIQRASEQADRGDRAVFAELRRRRPDLDIHVLSKRAMVALSNAMEDECCAQAERPLLYGSFQREGFFRLVETRWRELSRSAEVSVVFADFPVVSRPDGGPVEVPLDPSSPVLREWALVCDAPRYSACLVGWEQPQQRTLPDHRRPYEAMWSVEPEVVRQAALICNARAQWAAPDLADRASARLQEAPASIGPQELRVAATLTSRMAAYLSSRPWTT